jgi:hypothetical protein
MFIIEDELHAEEQEGAFATFEDAVAELRRRASIAWNVEPNQAPCTSWEKCGRRYEVVELEVSNSLRKEVRRILVLDISAEGVNWSSGFEP